MQTKRKQRNKFSPHCAYIARGRTKRKRHEEKFEELQRLLGKESVYSGQFDEEWKDIEVRLKQ